MSIKTEDPVRLTSTSARFYAIIGVLIALSWPFAERLFLANSNGGRLASVHEDIRTIVLEWLIVALLAAVAFGLQRVRPRFFRIRRLGWLDLLIAFVGLLAALIFSAAVSAHVAAPKFDLRGMAAVPITLRASLVLTAAICEEFIYRGFAIEELGTLTGSRWVGAVGSLALFTLGHAGVYGFSTALLIPASIGLVITLLYMFRNSLPVCMLVHAGIDGLFLIVVPALLNR